MKYKVITGPYFVVHSSVLSSAQRFTFPSTSPFVNDNTADQQDAEYFQSMQDIYADADPDVNGLDGTRRSSDLYSPELNLEAHRTAQEVLIHFLVLSVLLILFINRVLFNNSTILVKK